MHLEFIAHTIAALFSIPTRCVFVCVCLCVGVCVRAHVSKGKQADHALPVYNFDKEETEELQWSFGSVVGSPLLGE